MSVLIDLISGDGTDIERGWLDTFGEHLTSEEVLLLRRATTRPRRIESLLRSSGRKASSQDEMTADEDADRMPAQPTHPLLELADAYHETIATLIQRATATAEAKKSTPTPVGAEPGTNDAQLRWRVAHHDPVMSFGVWWAELDLDGKRRCRVESGGLGAGSCQPGLDATS
jgi:hypothetical protein